MGKRKEEREKGPRIQGFKGSSEKASKTNKYRQYFYLWRRFLIRIYFLKRLKDKRIN
jgi:hypothetical protein